MRVPILSILAPLIMFLSGCLGGSSPASIEDAPPTLGEADAASARSHGVVALIDTGINPYHSTFRDESPEAYLYPGTYIEGYPADAIALNVTFNETKWLTAVNKDCEQIWSKVEAGQLYWFPGTKIVGAVFLEGTPMACGQPTPRNAAILDLNGHGTMVASRAASKEYGACRDCKIVAIHFPASVSATNRADGDISLWAAKNAGWIDAQSNSWGPLAPIPFPDAAPQQYVGSSPRMARALESSSQAHLSFWASGNGAAFRAGILGHPTLVSPHMTPSMIIVGGHDSGYVNLWPGFPAHIISDSCFSWAAHHNELTKSGDSVGGGTSGATPFAAGGAVDILLQARRLLNDTGNGVHEGIVAQGDPTGIASGPLSDGKFTLAEWKDLVYKTASRRPVRQYEDGAVCDVPNKATTDPKEIINEAAYVLYDATPVMWKDVPDAQPEYTTIGYGAVDNASKALALQVLEGKKPVPSRPATDSFLGQVMTLRKQFYDQYSKLP